MTNPVQAEIVVGVITFVITFVVSVGTTMFISGMHWGALQTKVNNIEKDLAEIKGMFTLKLKE